MSDGIQRSWHSVDNPYDRRECSACGHAERWHPHCSGDSGMCNCPEFARAPAPVSSSSGSETDERLELVLRLNQVAEALDSMGKSTMAATVREGNAAMTWAWSEGKRVVAAVTAERERADAELAGLRERIEALADEVAASQRLADFDGVVKMRPGAIAAVIRALGSATKTGEGT